MGDARHGCPVIAGSALDVLDRGAVRRLGVAAGVALLAAIGAMFVTRSELVALLTGMAMISAARFLGF